MIRFVDLRGQECISRFAFFDTVTDHFIKAGGIQAWEDWEDFASDCDSPGLTTRCQRLCPPWVFEKEAPPPEWTTDPPTEEGWYWTRTVNNDTLMCTNLYLFKRGPVGIWMVSNEMGGNRAVGGINYQWWPVRIEEPPVGEE